MSHGPYTEGWPKTTEDAYWFLQSGDEIQVVPFSDAERMRRAIEEIVNWPVPVGIDDPVKSSGKLTENTVPRGDLYGMRMTTARQILRDALGAGK
jgi:hypothetical protein